MSYKRDVAYFFDEEIGVYHFATNHVMKPLRDVMTNELVQKYGLYPKMKIYNKDFINMTEEDFTVFHSSEYIEVIKNVTPENRSLYEDQLYQFNFGEDCPVFDMLYDYCCLYTGGSILGAQLLNEKKTDIVINWAGGRHHAKKCEASGFCYINDCVLSILELLKSYERVLYIDIDVHHGDGVEEAFYTTDRVLTCSFHKFGNFFPGTGRIDDKGIESGTNHAVNFPLKDGMDDMSYEMIFKPGIREIIQKFDPKAIVLQCGADSLSGDRLGCFNLSIKGHGEAVNYVKSFGIPMLMLGGGGYTLRNIPRCWAYETSIAVGEELADELPENEYMDYFGPDYRLHFPVNNMENENTKEYMDFILNKVMHNLKQINTTGLDLSNHRDGHGMTVDIDDMSKANRDKIEEELIDSHITKSTPNANF